MGALVSALVFQSLVGRDYRSSASSLVVLMASASLVALNQQRLQAWAYLLMLFTTVIVSSPPERAVKHLRWLLISLYCYSALGKFDSQFVHTVGQQLLDVGLGLLGGSIESLTPTGRWVLVLLFPTFELAVAIGLAWPKTRRLAGLIAILLHLGLIVLLGPLGLNHRPSVLVWNVQVALQAYWLFCLRGSSDSAAEATSVAPSAATERRSARIAAWVGQLTVWTAMTMPLGERLGCWDHWPSWALYAPHSSRALMEVSAPAVERLPAALRALMADQPDGDDSLTIWREVPMDRWSLQALDTPIYPQARFQLGVAEWLATGLSAHDGVRVRLLSSSARWSGARTHLTLPDLQSIQQARRRYWFNTHPRKWPSRNNASSSSLSGPRPRQ